MKCDCCHLNDFNEVLVLRKDKFTKQGKAYKNYRRVCIDCLKKLVKRGIYNLGTYWTDIILNLNPYTY